jgi:molybdopterin-binding protein
MRDFQNVKGVVEFFIEDKLTNSISNYLIKNTILRKGKEALAATLANSTISLSQTEGGPSERNSFYISRMIFGDGGVNDNDKTKSVAESRYSLYGTKILTKPVIASIDPKVRTEVIFTSVVSYSEGNGSVLNEMALQMANGELYSMVTFPNLTKTENIQITWNWRINFI